MKVAAVERRSNDRGMIVERRSIDSGARAPRGGRFWRSLSAEAVAQTIACLDFLYVCDKVTILG